MVEEKRCEEEKEERKIRKVIFTKRRREISFKVFYFQMGR
jgi:hypothetical protein